MENMCYKEVNDVLKEFRQISSELIFFFKVRFKDHSYLRETELLSQIRRNSASELQNLSG